MQSFSHTHTHKIRKTHCEAAKLFIYKMMVCWSIRLSGSLESNRGVHVMEHPQTSKTYMIFFSLGYFTIEIRSNSNNSPFCRMNIQFFCFELISIKRSSKLPVCLKCELVMTSVTLFFVFDWKHQYIVYSLLDDRNWTLFRKLSTKL